MMGFGNPKGELRICPICNREHDILRGTRCWCACGEEIRSKEYIEENKNSKDGKVTIKGKVTKIIKPEKVNEYFLPEKEKFKGKYYVQIEKEGLPKNYFKRVIFFNFKGKNDTRDYFLTVVMDKCDYKKGEIVSFEAEPHNPKPEVYVKNE